MWKPVIREVHIHLKKNEVCREYNVCLILMFELVVARQYRLACELEMLALQALQGVRITLGFTSFLLSLEYHQVCKLVDLNFIQIDANQAWMM